ncbi:hypothetical protein A5789_05755 [Nocardia sp. 852002-51101_SCH5132738]|nr:hypothetical protein A5789_05755 [Nocardia sp. 852002-51101_SCH5132738]OBB38575.1 hypothetical protein A5748_02660 [Nocardia sp. 852002-51244_SCH5132740]OBF82949.1 hypothetical protein A9X06_18465 [Mycobacterium sp. 852002-51759_SCH5129042]
MHLLADAKYAMIEIDVTPPNADDFTGTQSVEREQDEGWIERVLAGSIEKLNRLIGSPVRCFLGAVARQFDQAGDVSGDHFLAHCVGEGGAEHFAGLVEGGDRSAVGVEVVEEGLHRAHGQSVEVVVAEARFDVQTYSRLVPLHGEGTAFFVFEPEVQVFADFPCAVGR